MERYELTLLINAKLDKDEVDKTVEKVEKAIEVNGGKLVSKDDWGVKEFAYEIKNQKRGYYVFIQFDMNPASIDKVTFVYHYLKEVIRYLLVNLTRDKTYFKQIELSKKRKIDFEKKAAWREMHRKNELDIDKLKRDIAKDAKGTADRGRNANYSQKPEREKTPIVEKKENVNSTDANTVKEGE